MSYNYSFNGKSLNGLLGEDFTECSVDGVHQTDLGFLRMANGIEPTIRKLLAAHA